MAARVFHFNPDLGPKSAQSTGFPRSLLVLSIVATADGKSDGGVERGEITAKIENAFIWNEETKKLEAGPSFVGKEKRVHVNYPDGKSEGGDKAREQEMKALLVSAQLYSPEQIKQLGPNSQWDIDWFQGRRLFIKHDPAPAGSNEYAKDLAMTEALFAKLVTGEETPSWPFDGWKPKAQSDAAAGARPTGPGSMLPGQGAPAQVGRPAGIPAPTVPQAAAVPAPGGAPGGYAPQPAPGGYAPQPAAPAPVAAAAPPIPPAPAAFVPPGVAPAAPGQPAWQPQG